MIRLFFTALFFLLPTIALAGPPPMNPAAMSGIPRPDGNLAAGTVTVRCLGPGGFGDPKVGVEVDLAVRGADGKIESFKAKTQDEGRATFDQLEPFIGGTAIASVELGGKRVTSQPMKLLPASGTAVLLVEGASAVAPAHGDPGGPEIPPPGTAFPLKQAPVGTVTVGTYDLASKSPITGVEITLTITPPDGKPTVRTGKTDDRGKFVFRDLAPPDVPEGSKLTVEGTLRDELRKSQPFEMDKSAGMAVVLAEGAENWQAEAQAEPPPQAQRQPLPGPRRTSQLKPGTVDVLVVDANDQPISGQAVTVVKRTASGISGTYAGETGSDGRARVDGIDIQQDAGYFVETVYDDGPYQSGFFFMDKRGGVQVALRVFETTNDPGVVRSAVQYDIEERENDMAQVVQIYEVMVSGDKAFWDPLMKIEAPEDAKAFTVLRPAEDMLDHEEKARFATLHGPVPPGELTNLSVAYLMPHSGEVELRWQAPFEIVQASILVGSTLTLEAASAEKTDLDSPIPDKVVYTVPPVARGSALEFKMTGLKIRNPIYRFIGIGGGIALFLATVVSFFLYPRKTPRQRLDARRKELLRRLADKPEAADRERIIQTLDRVYRQLDALDAVDRPAKER